MNNENIFEITIKSQHEHVTLRENTPEKDFIQMGEYKYYKFTVVSSDEVLYFIDSKIRRLHFQLTPLQGDA
jgi:c-di-AMP phosphodiesterase-like protein